MILWKEQIGIHGCAVLLIRSINSGSSPKGTGPESEVNISQVPFPLVSTCFKTADSLKVIMVTECLR